MSDENTESSDTSSEEENEDIEENEDMEESSSQETEGLNQIAKVGIGVALLLVIVGLGIAAAQFGGLPTGNDVSEFDYPNGSNETGFNDPAVLSQSHSQTLAEDSYTVELQNTADGSTAELTYQYDPQSGLGYRVEDIDNQNNREFVEDYNNQEVAVASGLGTDNTTYQRAFLQQPVPYTANFDIQPFLESANYEATEVTQTNGEQVVVYESQGLTEEVSNQTSVDNFDAEIHLTDRGYFTLLNVTVTTTQNGQTIEEEQSIEVRNVGETTVSEPDWLSTAREQTEDPEPPQPPQPPQQPPEEDGSGDDTNETTTEDGGGDDTEE